MDGDSDIKSRILYGTQVFEKKTSITMYYLKVVLGHQIPYKVMSKLDKGNSERK